MLARLFKALLGTRLHHRKRFDLGPVVINTSNGRLTSLTGRLGRFSTNTRSRRLRARLPGGFHAKSGKLWGR